MIGKTISHYKILEKLGGGGMGVVYKARDTKLDRTVALKFLPPHLHLDEEAEQRFISEAKAASSFDHPNICTIYEINKTDEDQIYIAMACYERESLKEKLNNGPLKIDEITDYSIQIAKGLERAHEAGITHRDIKPANIMITNHGEVKILDFGLAKSLNDPGITKIGSTIGTASYMSPEQAKGTEVNHQSDIWSLGVVMYQMITGSAPFKGDYEQAVIYSILNEEPVPISEQSQNCPQLLIDIVNKCLKKNPSDRYQTTTELLDDLKIIANDPDGESKILQQKTGTNKTGGFFTNKKKLAVAAGVIILLIFLSSILPSGLEFFKSLLGFNSAPAEQHLLVLPLTNIGGDESNQAFCDGLMETLSSKLTQIEQFEGSLWVVPSSEVIRNKIKSPDEANQRYGVNLAVTGSLQFLDNLLRLTLNLVDAKNLRQINSSVIDVKAKNISSLQNKSVIKLLEMLHIELEPELKDILSAGGTDVPEAYETYVQGRGYLQRYENVENIDKAINLFARATEFDSLYALAYAGLGESYWRKYEVTKISSWVELAEKECEKGFKLDSLLAPVNVTLGMIYSGTGSYEHAIDHFNRALLNEPSNAAAYRGLAKVYETLESFKEAERTFKRAIGLKPDYWAGYNDLGVFYYKRGRYEDAIDQFKMVIKLTPDNYRGYNNLGGIYYMLERREDAREMFERSLTIHKSYNIYSNLATLYFIEEKYEDAARTYELALELNENDYLVWGNLAAAYFLVEGKKSKAIDTYKHAIEIAEERLKVNPKDSDVISNLARYYSDIGNKKKSLKLLRQSLDIAPDNVEVMYRAASTYEKLGMRDDALEWIGNAIVNGYPRSEIESQPELKQLVTDERYQQMLRDNNFNLDSK
ncbi:protein kinase [Bacteroidota bacterium]